MGIGALVHGIKAVGHACVGDFAGVAVEGGKAVVSLAVGTVVKEVAEETGVSDWLEDLFS
jgi:hypothetical protein